MTGLVDARGRPYQLDGLANVLTGLNNGAVDHRLANRIWGGVRLNQANIDLLYETDPIAATIVDAAPEDATRRGFDLEGDCTAKDWTKRTLDALDALRAMPALSAWAAKNRKDGGALLLLEVDDGGMGLETPLDLSRVLRVRRLEVLERWGVIIDRDMDRKSPTFGRPLSYSIHQANRVAARIHASRVIVLDGIRVSENRDMLDGGWGLSALQRPREALEAYAELWGYIQTTFKHFSTLIYKMAGLGALMQAGQDELVRRRLALFSQYVSTVGMTPVDSEDDIVERAVSFSGVADMLRQAQDRVASAANMPLTKLFGHAPAGLSTDDESGRSNWDDTVQSLQTRVVVPGLNRLLDVLFASKAGPTGGVVPTRYQLTPRPLRQPSEKDRSESRSRDTQSLGVLTQLEIITPAQAARALIALDPTNPYGLTDDDIRGMETPLPPAEEPPAPDAPAPIVTLPNAGA